MKRAMTFRGGNWLLLAAVALFVGCAESKPDRPKTYPVSGTVTYNGQPVADASLNFRIADGSSFAMARTDASGKYQLMTYEAGDGAVPGEYKIGITKYENTATTSGPGMDDAEYASPKEEAEGGAPPKNLLPEKYMNPETSGLTATVTEGPNTANFELTD